MNNFFENYQIIDLVSWKKKELKMDSIICYFSAEQRDRIL